MIGKLKKYFVPNLSTKNCKNNDTLKAENNISTQKRTFLWFRYSNREAN